MTKKLPSLGVACLLSATWACGGGGSPAAPTALQPFNQSISGNVGVFGTTFHALTTARGGNLRITLAWPGSVDLDLYLVNPSCGNDGTLTGCQFFAIADGLANPELVTHTVTAAQTYRIVVDNNSEEQAVAYNLAISIQ